MRSSLSFFFAFGIPCISLCFGGQSSSQSETFDTKKRDSFEVLLILIETKKYSKIALETFKNLNDKQKKAYIEKKDSWTKQSNLVLTLVSTYKKYNKKNHFLLLKECSCIAPKTTYHALCYWKDFLLNTMNTQPKKRCTKILSLLQQIQIKHNFSNDEKELYRNITNGNTVLRIQNQIDDALRYLKNEKQIKTIKNQDFYGEPFEKALKRHITKKTIPDEDKKKAKTLYEAFQKIKS